MLLPDTIFDGVIDVSHHNGRIDWPAVAAAGIALAFIKASEGLRFVDPKFDANRIGADKAGLAVVPYHFLNPGDPPGQARHFLAVAGLAPGQPAMLDWETEATAADLIAIGEEVSAVIGRDPVGYYGWAQLAAAHAVLSRWPLMLPAYPRGNTPGKYETLVWRAPRLPPGRPSSWDNGPRPYDFHQYTPAGHIAGIPGPVDRSIWVGSVDDLRHWHVSGTLPIG